MAPASNPRRGRSAQRGREASVRRALAHGTAVASHTVHQFGVEGLTDLTPAAIQRRVHEVREVCRFDLE